MKYLSSKELLASISASADANSTTKNYTELMKNTASIANGCINIALEAIEANGSNVNSNLVFYADAVTKHKNLKSDEKIIAVGSKNLSATSISSARAIFEILKIHPLSAALSEAQLLGILGNMAHESEFDPALWEGQSSRIWTTTKLLPNSKPAFGLTQFTYSEAALALENIVLAWNKNNIEKLCDSNILASIIINPIYQIDHVLRSCLAENRVDRPQFYFNQKSLKSNNFFVKGKNVDYYAKAFLLGYERPRDKGGSEQINRSKTAVSLSKLL